MSAAPSSAEPDPLPSAGSSAAAGDLPPASAEASSATAFTERAAPTDEVAAGPLERSESLAGEEREEGGGASPSFRFGERALAVLFAPQRAFAHHDASWGWVAPWALAAACGLLLGIWILSAHDLGAALRAQAEAGLERLPEAQRQALESGPAREVFEKSVRMQAFFLKTWLLAGPLVGGLFEVLAVGALLYLASRWLGPPSGPRDLMRCISLAAWLSLVEALRYLACACGAMLGNPFPQTSPAALVDPLAHPVLHSALAGLDPLLLLYYGLLASAVAHGLRFSRGRALAFAWGIYGAGTVLRTGLAGLGVLAQSLASRGTP